MQNCRFCGHFDSKNGHICTFFITLSNFILKKTYIPKIPAKFVYFSCKSLYKPPIFLCIFYAKSHFCGHFDTKNAYNLHNFNHGCVNLCQMWLCQIYGCVNCGCVNCGCQSVAVSMVAVPFSMQNPSIAVILTPNTAIFISMAVSICVKCGCGCVNLCQHVAVAGWLCGSGGAADAR
jgi:hypothetical protein